VSVSNFQSIAVSTSAQNIEFIQCLLQLSQSDQNQQIVVLNKDTGSLAIQSEKTATTAWVVFASLEKGTIKRREIIVVVSDAALKVLSGTLHKLDKKDAYSKFEHRRMRHLEKQVQGYSVAAAAAAPSAAAASASAASAVVEPYLVIPAQNALLSLFLESAIRSLIEDVSQKAAAISPGIELDQVVVDHVTNIILEFNELHKTTPEDAKVFVQELMQFAMANKAACQATVARTGHNLYIKAFNAERDDVINNFDGDEDNAIDHSSDEGEDPYTLFFEYSFKTEHRDPLKAYHWCHRAVQYNRDGSIYAHLTKKKLRNPDQPLGQDLGVGKGTNKVVSLAVRIDQIEAEPLASSGSVGPLEDEVYRLKTFKDIKGVLKFRYGVTYAVINHSEPDQFLEKDRMLTNYCNQGTLDEEIGRRTLSDADRAFCVKQLVEILFQIHERGWVYRDLKPQNIFLHRTEEGVLELTLGDLSSACLLDCSAGPEGSEDNRCFFESTPHYAPPELIEIINRHKHFDLTRESTEAMQSEVMTTNRHGLDLWALACILWEMYEPTELPWLNTFQASASVKGYTEAQSIERMVTHMIETKLRPLPFDDNNKRHRIIKSLMDIDPEKRLPLRDLRMQLDDLENVRRAPASSS